ncbi:hypothetical protein MIC97_12785 [Aquamicrobium sp. NLF2-7]|uniref:hypothetical protein n=1 Tax=Aquamicrobium sp. NLF2-7 TaxID=2918753 RepID=UPI001EFA42D1|nr:hypothetical protein [Aquamicrobium sp. NLF2-7]MCG8272376.1 hypothetical protein [Aquamicrobium sp. NLF2-7]
MRTMILAAVFAVTCSASWAYDRIPVSPAIAERVKEGIAAILKDPESARFGDFTAAMTPDGAIYVCGTVNARNSFGGYAGSSPFVGVLANDNAPFKVERLGSDENEIARVITRCQAVGALSLF